MANNYNTQQQRPSHDLSAYYKALGAVVVIVAAIALLAKLLHSCLRSLKDAQEAGRRRRRRPPPPSAAADDDVELTLRRRAPPPPPAVRAAVVGPPLVLCTYRRADEGWPAEAEACAVCLAELADGEAVRVLPVCMHYFHAACVGEWLRAHDTCPLCRAPLAPPPADAAAGDDAAVSNNRAGR